MKTSTANIILLTLLLILLLIACTQGSSSSPSSNSNMIYLKDNFQFDIRVCPFSECERVYQYNSGGYIEATAYDGRSTDINSRTVWLQVIYEGNNSGWLFANPDRIDIPNGLLDRLPVAAWVTPTPVPTPTGDPAFILKTLCYQNVYKIGMNPNLGKTFRFKTPIQIYTKGIRLINEAAANIERLTNGLVTFEIVDHEPAVGIIVIEGDVPYDPSNSETGVCNCGGVSPERVARSNGSTLFSVGEDGYINSQVFYHFGGPACDLVHCSFPYGAFLSPTSGDEHELAHVLGLGGHFDGFTGFEGFSYNVNVVISALYSMPSGTDMSNACIPYNPIPNAPNSNVPATHGSPVTHPCPSSTGPGGTSAINLDGISSDWLDIPPLTTDAQESGLFDFAGLYACSDETNLYLRVDPYESFPSNVPAQFAFDITAEGENPGVFQAFTIPNQPEDVHLAPQGNNGLQWDLQKIYKGAALGQVFELVIPLEYLGYPDMVTIHAYVNPADSSTNFDSFDPVEYTIKTATATNTPTPLPNTSPAATGTP